MGCLCELFENETLWLICLTLLVLYSICGGGSERGGCGCR